MKHILNFMKGFFIGLANVVPGVSGGALAIITGIYDKLLLIASNIIKGIKENFFFLAMLGSGAVIAVGIGSVAIPYCLDTLPFATILFFIGLIIGGIPALSKNLRGEKINLIHILIFIISAAGIIALAVLKPNEDGVTFEHMQFNDYLILFLIGIIAAATMVIPGISGSLVLMLLGYYTPILNCIKEILTFTNIFKNIFILAPIGFGLVCGVIGIAKMLTFFLKRYKVKTFYSIFGFLLASIFGIFYQTAPQMQSVFASTKPLLNAVQVIIGILLFIGGIILTFKLSKYEEKKENEKQELKLK